MRNFGSAQGNSAIRTALAADDDRRRTRARPRLPEQQGGTAAEFAGTLMARTGHFRLQHELAGTHIAKS